MTLHSQLYIYERRARKADKLVGVKVVLASNRRLTEFTTLVYCPKFLSLESFE
jgi:hypothetical protein